MYSNMKIKTVTSLLLYIKCCHIYCTAITKIAWHRLVLDGPLFCIFARVIVSPRKLENWPMTSRELFMDQLCTTHIKWWLSMNYDTNRTSDKENNNFTIRPFWISHLACWVWITLCQSSTLHSLCFMVTERAEFDCWATSSNLFATPINSSLRWITVWHAKIWSGQQLECLVLFPSGTWSQCLHSKHAHIVSGQTAQ